MDIAMGAVSLAAPYVGLAYGVYKVADLIGDAIMGKGMFGPTPLPFGRGRGFSAADNLASQTSKYLSTKIAEGLQGVIQQAKSPMDLLGLAAAGRTTQGPYHSSLAPHGEVQFFHPAYGEPAAFQAALKRIVETDDAGLLRQFISGVSIQTGETGATTHNFALTDWYRRQLVSLLPEDSPLRKDMAGLFEPLPAGYAEENFSWTPEGGLSSGYHPGVSPLFRPARTSTPQAVYEAQKARIPPPDDPTAYNPINMANFAKLERFVRDPQILAPYVATPTMATPEARALLEDWKARIPPPFVPSGLEFEGGAPAPYNPINMEAYAALQRLVAPASTAPALPPGVVLGPNGEIVSNPYGYEMVAPGVFAPPSSSPSL